MGRPLPNRSRYTAAAVEAHGGVIDQIDDGTLSMIEARAGFEGVVDDVVGTEIDTQSAIDHGQRWIEWTLIVRRNSINNDRRRLRPRHAGIIGKLHSHPIPRRCCARFTEPLKGSDECIALPSHNGRNAGRILEYTWATRRSSTAHSMGRWVGHGENTVSRKLMRP